MRHKSKENINPGCTGLSNDSLRCFYGVFHFAIASGIIRLEVVVLNSHALAKAWNSSAANGELSLMTSDGMPYLQNWCFRACTMSLMRCEGRRWISKNPER